MSLKRIISLSLVIVLSLNAAGVSDSIKTAFGGDRVLTNTTEAGEWKDPGSGITYYSGGSLTVKFKPATFEPWFSARAPSYNIGCSGFSYDLGFASIIDMDKLTDQLSSAGTSIIGGFMSSILYSTPILGDIIKTVKKIAALVSKLLRDACAIGKSFGNEASSGMSTFFDKELGIDSSKAIDRLSDLGIGAHTQDLRNNIDKFSKQIDCFTQKNQSTCLDSNTKNQPQINILISNAIADTSTCKQANRSGIVDKLVDVKQNAEADVFIDTISLSKLIKGQASKLGLIEQSRVMKQYGQKVVELILVGTGGTVTPSSTCKMLKEKLNMMIGAEGSTNKQILNIVSKNLSAVDSIAQPQPRNGTFNITTANSSKNIFIDFLNDGIKVKIPNMDIYVVQKSTKITTATNTNDKDITVKKYVFVCSPKNGSFYETTWSGLSSIVKTQARINKIINAETTANTNDGSILLSETVRLAQALIKRNKLKQEGEEVLPTYLSSYTLALFNQFMITEVIYNAMLESFKSAYQDSTNSAGDNMALDKKLASLKKEKALLFKKMQKNIGKIDLVATLRREAISIEKEYKEATLKRTQR